jgi:hypothetical protein
VSGHLISGLVLVCFRREESSGMQSQSLKMRKRGGQPGNRNAVGNRGNPRPRRNFGNRGGGGPVGNQNARRWPKGALAAMLREYADSAEASAWLRANAEELSQTDFTDDNQRDAALFAAFCGATPEELAAQGREYDLGLYVLPEEHC